MGPYARRRAGLAVTVVWLSTQAIGGSAASQESLPLEAGAVRERTMAAGDVHRYDVDLGVGDYLAVVVEQHGIDALPVIVDPAGVVVYEYDFGEWGDDPAAIVATTPGRHRVEIRTVAGGPPRGRYRLRVEAIRAASALDERRAATLRRQSEALPLVRGQPRNLVRARQEYEAILGDWQALSDGLGVAHALTALGFIVSGLDDRPAALDLAIREVEAYRAIGHDYGEARALRTVGIDARSVGEIEQASAAFTRSLEMHRAANRRSSIVLLLADLANDSGASGDFGRALEFAYEAIDMARADGNARLEAIGWSAAALAHQSLGELEVSLDAYRRTRTLAPTDDVRQADSATRMGAAYLALGDAAQAERSLQEGLALWQRRGFRAQQAQALIGLGDVAIRLGRLDRAREHFAAAISLAAESSYPLGEVTARRRLAETLLDIGQIAEAEAALSAPGLDRVANPITRARVTAVRARAALARGDLGTARLAADEAMALTESALGRAQSTRIDAGVLASAQPGYETAVHVAMAAHAVDPTAGHDARAFALSERARARSLLDLLSAPGPDQAPAPSDRLLERELRQLRRRLNAKGTALETAGSRLRPTLVRDIDELAARLALLEAQLRRERPMAAAVAAPAPLSVTTLQQRLLDDRTVLIEYLLGTPHSYAWVVSHTSFTSVRLASRDAIEAAARRALTLAEPPAAGTAVLRSSPSAGRELAALILEPLGALPAGRRLLIVAPGVLQDVPFAALPTDDAGFQPLIARHEIQHLPSAAAALAMASDGAKPPAARRSVAVFADPVFAVEDPRVQGAAPPETTGPPLSTPLARAWRGGANGTTALGRLPFTRLEADRITAAAPTGTVTASVGFAANLQTLRTRSVSASRVLHFATHGILNTRTPELSGLVLSLVDERGRPREGFLRLHEVEDLRLDAELVVLSACETARGRLLEGEGTIGLTRAFLAAGARHVVASLWRVDDAATAELMHAFYTQLLRQQRSPAAALRAAQRQMAGTRQWAHPYYWAGFVVLGAVR